MKHSLASKGIRSKTRQGNFNSNGISNKIISLKNEYIWTYQEWKKYKSNKENLMHEFIDFGDTNTERKQEIRKILKNYDEDYEDELVDIMFNIQEKLEKLTGEHYGYEKILGEML